MTDEDLCPFELLSPLGGLGVPCEFTDGHMGGHSYAVRRHPILDALSRESHADSPHGDGFVETRGDAT